MPSGWLEDRIAKLAEAGELTGLTLWKTIQGWQANYRMAEGWRIEVHHDPLEALRKALPTPTVDEEEDLIG